MALRVGLLSNVFSSVPLQELDMRARSRIVRFTGFRTFGSSQVASAAFFTLFFGVPISFLALPTPATGRAMIARTGNPKRSS